MEEAIVINNEDSVEEGAVEQTHVVPEIEVKERFFDFNAGKDYLELKLTSSGVSVESADKSMVKNLSNQGLVKSLSNQASLDTGFMPILGERYLAVRRYMVVKNKHYVFIESSPMMRNIHFQDGRTDKKFTIPFPGLMFAAILREDSNGNTTFLKDESRMFALRTPVYNETVALYNYPFTNVYNDFRICWGDTLHSGRTSVQQTAGLLETFLSGINNHDLYNSANAHMRADILDVFADLAKKESYPSDTLKPARDLTFKSMVTLVTQNG
jgi:hypothetical protein